MAAAVIAESRYDPRADLVEALDAQLCELVRSGAPLRRALARVAGALVARRAGEPLGFVRPGDYARERPGLSGRELHDLAHVGAALARRRFERLGIPPRKARALLRVERACALAPALGGAWHAGDINGCQAQALVPLVLAPGSEPFHAAWIERAGGVTVRRLEDDVEHALASGAFDPTLLPELPELPEGVRIGAEHMGGLETDIHVRPLHRHLEAASGRPPAPRAPRVRA